MDAGGRSWFYPTMRYLLVLMALICGTIPAAAQRGHVGANARAMTAWRWTGTRTHDVFRREGERRLAGERRREFGRSMVTRNVAVREVRAPRDILTGTNQRIDILTGRLID